MGRQNSGVMGAKMPQPGIQEADRELPVPPQCADDLAHLAAVARGTGRGGHQVNVVAADLPLQLGLLALGDQRAAAARDADVLRGQAIRQRAGTGLGGTSQSAASTLTPRPSSVFMPRTSRMQPAAPGTGWSGPGKPAAVQSPCQRNDGSVEGSSARRPSSAAACGADGWCGCGLVSGPRGLRCLAILGCWAVGVGRVAGVQPLG